MNKDLFEGDPHGQRPCGGREPAAVPPTAPDPTSGDAECGKAVHQSARAVSPSPSVSGERLYFVGNTLLARGSGRDLAPRSILIYCEECGEVWARVVEAQRHTGAASPKWSAEQALCIRHIRSAGTRWYIPGSIIPALRVYTTALGNDYPWDDLLPANVLEREAKIHLQWWAGERGQELRQHDYWRGA